MDQRNLKAAKEFAVKYGVKSICYGAPGSGKTPLSNTAPRPVMLACEPGLLSMRTSDVPTYTAWEVGEGHVKTAKRIDDFFQWVFNSIELKNFDTIIVDSVSEMANIYLSDAEKKNAHGLKAYGDMAENVMHHLRRLYYMQQKHIYLICKQEILEPYYRRPAFPGKELHREIPHLYDLIMNIGKFSIPNYGEAKAIRCIESFDCLARDRSGNLNEFELPDLSSIFNKCMR